MERFLKDKDIVTLSNNVKIIVLKTFTHNNDNYAYCQDTTDFDPSNPKYLIAKEIIQDNNPQIEILANAEEIEQVLVTLRTLLSK